MLDPHPRPDGLNRRIARTLEHAVEHAPRPRHLIAADVGMHINTLRRVLRGNRAIGLDEATKILRACGAPAGAVMALVLTGHDALARQWMHHEMGAFLDAFWGDLPETLDRTLGENAADLRPRWALGLSRLIANTLAKHIDEVATRDLAAVLVR